MSVAYDRYPEWEPQDDQPPLPPAATVVPFPMRRRLLQPVDPAGAAVREPEQPDLQLTAPPAPAASVVAFVPEPVRPEPRPLGRIDLPEVRTGGAGAALAPARTRPVRPAPRPGRGPSPCPASAPVLPEAGERGGLRLTRRGRQLLALVSAIGTLTVIALSAWLLTAALTRPVVPDSAPSVVVVHSGESLWTIAHDLAPGSDPRKVVAAIQERNHLDTPVVHPGQTLQIPG